MKSGCSCDILKIINKLENEIKCILKLKCNDKPDCNKRKTRKCENECEENNSRSCKCDC